jgi:hypothetical protein
MYSNGYSYLNIKFYNTNLSFQFHPFISKDSNGRDVYDFQNTLMTTINLESAFALYKISKEIIDGKHTSMLLTIPCASDASLTLERRAVPQTNGQMETILSINKNGKTIPFKFKTISVQTMENNQMVTRVIEVGLGALQKTIDGYLTGINSERHLNKLTDDYIKSLEGDNQKSQFQTGSGYNNFKSNGNFNNKWKGRKNFNDNNQPQQSWEPQQQNMSSYQIQN